MLQFLTALLLPLLAFGISEVRVRKVRAGHFNELIELRDAIVAHPSVTPLPARPRSEKRLAA